MLGRTVFAATLFALAQFAVAAPPACLLAAASQYSDPATVKMVCQSKDMKSMVATICPNDVDAAVAALADICNGQNAHAASGISATAPLTTGSSPKPTGTGASTLVPMYPTGSGSHHSANGTAPISTGSPSSANGTTIIATGTPKPVPSTTGHASVPSPSGAAGKVDLGLAAVFVGFMVAAL
ncbi:hypothetical protein COCC4DRAFT_52162 [Bipolaris maydis ATCC 48331]|uniref:Extracellular membrane protein CFEM domain-containing protein n=2 Tax=Cochliobolus heterostrophus TaxID=5016 RepID=M2TJN1_COCH5|nr:uncharacterized protein COCC4DRAFT_52162 [Bipolaris maydis ATCC 48331]EMD97660.1 hypothetical protein COCHEDRAFT_1190447 [Bipolaris maydis C5]KAJ5031759.1 hypothetical protein J3E73DRAFT_3657 [Bipolaris maydis]ENI02942.1 hypothetical protein COCC4DRAFT_52162 [Bipolaris maydis ATCC 48331]KAJ5060189.1 hypothetical protein J3E74DRAFT_45196 [Bipolaris maydis]KAJ6202019.1 hypothetical protein J3E72DRAFT_25365 [Bipolaris maydis]